MRLNVQMTTTGDLELRAATYSTDEFLVLHSVLKHSGIGGFFKKVPFTVGENDSAGRKVRHYTVPKNRINRFEDVLGGRFDRQGRFETIPSKEGRNYACRDVNGTGCENIIATSQRVALVKCALIAGQNNWFGGVTNEGFCAE
jgi:hypothetical protein